jgi:hypothetical protein
MSGDRVDVAAGGVGEETTTPCKPSPLAVDAARAATCLDAQTATLGRLCTESEATTLANTLLTNVECGEQDTSVLAVLKLRTALPSMSIPSSSSPRCSVCSRCCNGGSGDMCYVCKIQICGRCGGGWCDECERWLCPNCGLLEQCGECDRAECGECSAGVAFDCCCDRVF